MSFFTGNNSLIATAKFTSIPFWTTSNSGQIALTTHFSGVGKISWGDGTIENITTSVPISRTLNNPSTISYIFSGGKGVVTDISQPNPIGNKVGGNVNVSIFPNLQSLGLGQYGISSVTWDTSSTILNYINYSSNSVTGSIPSLTNNIGLVHFYCHNNQLTGSIPTLSTLTSLKYFFCDNNMLTGTIPSLSSNTNLVEFKCNAQTGTKLTGSLPSLIGLNKLVTFSGSNNSITGSIPNFSTAGGIQLKFYYVQNNQLTGIIPVLGDLSLLSQFWCNGNQLAGFAGGGVSSTLGHFDANNNLLTNTAVNSILAAFVAAGRTNANGTCILRLGGTGNAAPTGQGITDKNTLISRGWTVTTN
jgi:hypothetical protein